MVKPEGVRYSQRYGDRLLARGRFPLDPIQHKLLLRTQLHAQLDCCLLGHYNEVWRV